MEYIYLKTEWKIKINDPVFFEILILFNVEDVVIYRERGHGAETDTRVDRIFELLSHQGEHRHE